jgi:hypothetical protein
MEDTKLFAQDCAVFVKKRLFTPGLNPVDLSRRIDATFYVVTQNLLGNLPNVPGITDYVMGTKGPVGPHLEQLLHYLRNSDLSKEFVAAMPDRSR